MKIDVHARRDLEHAADRIAAIKRVYADTLTPGEQAFMQAASRKLGRIVAAHGGATGSSDE